MGWTLKVWARGQALALKVRLGPTVIPKFCTYLVLHSSKFIYIIHKWFFGLFKEHICIFMFFILCCSFVSHIPVVKMIGGLRTFLKDLSQKDLWYKRTFNQKDLLARGPFPKDLLNQRTFGQKDLFSKGPFVKRTFSQMDLWATT